MEHPTDRSGQKTTTSTRGTKAVLFADLSGSTGLFERLGDKAARTVTRRVLGSLSEIARRYEGVLTKEIGDEIMCVFSTSTNAAMAAIQMQRHLNSGPERSAGLAARIGFHFGDVLMELDDVYGDTVNVASRLVGLAVDGQVLTCQRTLDTISGTLGVKTQRFGPIQLKGRKAEVAVVGILWQQDFDDHTSMLPVIQSISESRSVLKLSYRGCKMEIKSAGDVRQVTLGRSPENLFQVSSPQSSRKHAAIEVRNGKFYLVDRSTNGTFVKLGDGSQLSIKREPMLLHGRGEVSLGKEFPVVDATEISFEVC